MSQERKIQLLADGSADSAEFIVPLGGMWEWSIEGTFNGGSYKLQASGPNGTLYDVPGAVMSANGAMMLWFTPGTKVKLVESGTTSAMYSTLVGPVR